MTATMRTIRVAASSRTPATAAAIAHAIRADRAVTVQAIGVAAVNQAAKALAGAGRLLEGEGITLAASATFEPVEIEGRALTALRLAVRPVDPPQEPAEVELLRVAGASPVGSAAAAIANVVRNHRTPEVRAIGDQAVNQALKALAGAAHYLAGEGIAIAFLARFEVVEAGGKELNALQLRVVVVEGAG